jgi:two-component system cell cycle sensor histidine kinase/response regulator CckA
VVLLIDKSPLSLRTRAVIFLAVFALYFVPNVYLLSMGVKGVPTAIVLPPMAAGMLFGFVPGLIAGLLSMPLNIVLYAVFGQAIGDLIGVPAMTGYLLLIFMSPIVGLLRDMRLKLHDELILRKRAEAQLQEYLKELEGTVQSRTSELLKMEKQLYQTQKLESIGTLAGGVAHDFNNLLTGIIGRVSLSLRHTPEDDPRYRHLKDIQDIVGSAANLTGQLLGFARGGKYDVTPTDINELIKNQVEMFGRTKKEISIHENYNANRSIVEVDQSQIEQVLLNLFVNAWQAMPRGGDLYVETKRFNASEQYVQLHQLNDNQFIQITVTDTGIGMDSETRKKIFDPFFTTKEMGGGTGLGLASAYGIVKNHGGFINVYSEEGKGTTFTFYLPAATDSTQPAERVSPRAIAQGSETVLVVDDETIVSDVLEPMLQDMGYRVFTAKSGKSAVEIYRKNWQEISLIIVDFIMPGMDGKETFSRLQQINPDVKAIVSSGYSVDGRAREMIESGCTGVLQKPYDMEELSIQIRQVLDK